MSSMFDPQQFLDATTTEALERRPPLPTENPDDPNGLYTAVIGEVKFVDGVIKNGDRAGQQWVQMVVPLRIQVPSQVQAVVGGAAELTMTDRPMIDVLPNGSLDYSVGKNRGLRIYRDATGLNVKGEPFSPRMLQGKIVKVKVMHEIYQDQPMEKVKEVFPG